MGKSRKERYANWMTERRERDEREGDSFMTQLMDILMILQLQTAIELYQPCWASSVQCSAVDST